MKEIIVKVSGIIVLFALAAVGAGTIVIRICDALGW
jgi:hypothetical protein